MTSFDSAVSCWSNLQSLSLQFGHFALQAIEREGHSIRELSIAICGNEGLEDRIGRLVMAAEWDKFIRFHPIYKELYEDARDWLTTSHMTELQKLYKADEENALDAFEQVFVRNLRNEVEQIKPVEWLRAKRQGNTKSYLDKVKRYFNHIAFDLIETPLDGLNSKRQFDAAANVRENAKRLQESLQTLLNVIEAESERA